MTKIDKNHVIPVFSAIFISIMIFGASFYILPLNPEISTNQSNDIINNEPITVPYNESDFGIKYGAKIASNLQIKEIDFYDFWSSDNRWFDTNISSKYPGYWGLYIAKSGNNSNSYYMELRGDSDSKIQDINITNFKDILQLFYISLSYMDRYNDSHVNLNQVNHDISFSFLYNDSTGFAVIYSKEYDYIGIYEYAVINEEPPGPDHFITSIIEGNYTVSPSTPNDTYPKYIKIEAYMKLDSTALFYLFEFTRLIEIFITNTFPVN